MLGQDLRYGLRMMARSPIVSSVAVVSLALGMAASTSMFALADSWLFQPLPYEDPDELVLVRTLRTGDPIEMAGGVSVPNYYDLVEGAPSIESATLYTIGRANLTGADRPEQINLVDATPSIFEVFGVAPSIGRGFRPEEGVDGRVLVLEHDFWERRFLADRGVLGSTVTVDDQTYTVVGVLPEAFDLVPANVHAFRPSDFRSELEARGTMAYLAFARLRDGATPESVRREIAATGSRLSAEYPDANRGMEFVVETLDEFFPGPTDMRLLQILLAVTLFGLLIACANIANLLLARAEERQREVAVRTAMGAGRLRLLRQMLTESVLMGLAGGALGIVLSIWIVRWMQGVMPPEMPAVLSPRLSAEVVGVALLVAVAAGVVFGLAPALHSVAGDLRDALGGARGGTAGRSRKRVRSFFVVGEVAVALGLLSGAGFLIEAFDRLANDDPGFRAEGLLTFQLSVPESRYPGDEELASYTVDLERALEAVPGVDRVAIMSSLPRGRSNPRAPYALDERPDVDVRQWPTADFQAVNPTYFETMEIGIRQGRGFTEADRADGAPVAMISEALVARESPDDPILGRTIIVRGENRTVVGVAENILQDRIALAGRGGEQIYVPVAQSPLRNPSFAVRVRDDDLATVPARLRDAVWSVDAGQPVADLQTLEAFIDLSLAGPRAMTLFLLAMGIVALALATMGVYGVMAHSVTQQRREIGIRMALGADRGSVVGLVARSGLALVALGVLVGLPLTYIMFRATVTGLNLFLTEIRWGYALSFSVALIGVAVVATLLPASRASGVPPSSALQE